jgi:ribose transport system ATP-binding protein
MTNSASALRVVGIEMRFPGVLALRGASFDVHRGEIHGLVGENGAGKSTLMRVLAGFHRPSAGRILIDERDVQFASPRDAQDHGIAMVYQDTRLVPDLDVAQNIWLGREPGNPLLVDRRRMERSARSLLDQLGLRIPLDAPVRSLAFDERQIVEIARALTTDPPFLILDEPTSGLDRGETERLFVILRQLRAAGKSLIFISHRLPEVLSLVDRITVMKDGEVVGTVAQGTVDQDKLVSMMVGRSMTVAYPLRAERTGTMRLQVRGLASAGRLRDVGFSAAAGEIVGLGGIVGNGQTDIVRSLFGLLPHQGDIKVDGEPLRLHSPRQAIAAGIVYVPADRRRDGLFLVHSIRENVSVPHLGQWSRHGIVARDEERRASDAAIREFAVRTPSPEQRVALLSGGNQQKVVLGRWTRGTPRIYMFDEPTQGVDVATKLEIYRRVRELAASGAAIILVSSELLELIGLSDRIYVVSEGRVVDEVPAAEATEERIIGSAVGHDRAATSTAVSGATPVRASRRQSIFDRRYASSALLTILIAALTAATARQSPYFFSPLNLGDLALQIAPLALAALGQLAVVLLGGVDLSVGPTISLVTAIGSYLIVGDGLWPSLGGIGACLAAGLGVGVLNAAMILLLRIPDLISTLSTFSIVTGVTLLVRPSPGGELSPGFLDAAAAQIGPVPIVPVAVLLLYLVIERILVRGRIGMRLYAVGSSNEAAFVVGIRTGAVRAGAYVFCSLCAVLAGLMIAARIGSGDPQAGAQFTLTSITAVVIGGASVFGGRGTAIGTLAGAVLVGLMQNALNHLQVSAYYQYVWTGALTLAAVVLFSLGSRQR